MWPLPKFVIHSEQALLLDLSALLPDGSGPGPAFMQQIQLLRQRLPQLLGPALLELVPSYTSVLLIFDLLQTDHSEIQQRIRAGWPELNAPAPAELANKIIQLPCYYSSETGPDLAEVAAMHQLSIPQLINIHSQQQYQVYAIGFAPGFAYLGFTDPRIATPRLSSPRAKVAAGSVAIADRQSAVYPAESPGGWRLLGNCPLPLFNLHATPMLPFAVGDSVQFCPIDRAEFLRLGGQL